jgi:hypothetical protein
MPSQAAERASGLTTHALLYQRTPRPT